MSLKYTAVLALIILTGLPIAHAGTYFEYAPDPWRSERLPVSTVDTPFQFFQSASDFTLTGFDLWVDNIGAAGPVTFTLLDDETTTLAEKTITLGQTPAVPGGVKLHVTLDQPINISHYRTYSIQISNSLNGFGLYYANRINILEHNLNYTTEYALGVAQLGTEKQDFTFKFALEDPTEGGSSEPTPEELGVPSPTSTTATIISNARVIEITDTTAIAAWTTNLAADSRATVRTQLNPLYVYTTAYDPTRELEHTLLITGLTQNTAYFVDFFSQQSEDEPILTTYSVSFVTKKGAPVPPPDPSPTSTTAATSSNQSVASTSNASSATQTSTTQTNTGATSTLSAVTFGAGSGADSFSVNWQPSAGGAPNGGYRIDIFDDQNLLIRQLRAPGDATSRNVAILPPGDHTVIVYADKDGVFEKVAAASTFTTEKARSPLFWFWYLMGVILSLLIAFAFLFSRREKTELAPLE